MQSSNNDSRFEKEWLLLAIGGIASVGTALTGFVLVEIMHIESRLAVLEFKVGPRGSSLSGQLWKKEISDARASLAAPLPFVPATTGTQKKALAK